MINIILLLFQGCPNMVTFLESPEGMDYLEVALNKCFSAKRVLRYMKRATKEQLNMDEEPRIPLSEFRTKDAWRYVNAKLGAN